MNRARFYDPLTHRYPRSIREIEDSGRSSILTSAFEMESDERRLREQLTPNEERMKLSTLALVCATLIALLLTLYWLVR